MYIFCLNINSFIP